MQRSAKLSKPARARSTRAARNQATRRLDLYVPYLVWVPVVAAAELFVSFREPLGAARVIGMLVTGYLVWGLFEYVVHRFVLHAREDGSSSLPGNRTHIQHHRQPNAEARLTVQLSESVPTAAVMFALFLLASGDLRMAVHLHAGFMAGYLFYEYLDFQAHHGLARGAAIRWFRRYHLVHHYADDQAHYGVTMPLFDLLFGSFRAHRKRSRVTQTISSPTDSGEHSCA
jgi:sterol desaturase/sphingolipid hydroxylase (fatty acid hydroxylase superfamily)